MAKIKEYDIAYIFSALSNSQYNDITEFQLNALLK